MSDFEFSSVVISILIAFALSELLASWGALVKRPPRSVSWLYVVLSIGVALVLVGHWLGLSAYRSLESISSEQSLLIFAPPFVLALAAHILSPDRGHEEAVDLVAHYQSVSRWVYGLLSVFCVLARLSDLLIPGQEPLPTWFQPALAVLFAVPVFVSDLRVHWGVIGGVAVLSLGTTWS